MPIHLSVLRAFCAVADERSFTRAARALHMSQPAVSLAIRELERSCGCDLFERRPRGVALTAAGTQFLDDARAVVSAARTADDAIAALHGLDRGLIHVGASTTIASYVLPGFIGRFLARHPGVDVRLSTAHTRGVVEMLTAYAIDIALTEAPVSHPRIHARKWMTERLIAVASPDHPLNDGRRVTAAALGKELLLLREPESGTGTIVRRALVAAGVKLGRTVEIDGPEAIKQIVASGGGVAIVSRTTVGEQLALGRLVELDVTGLTIVRPFYRLRLTGRRASPAARAFDRLLDEAD
jgi:DNA-binding transcriptional LysR family regulator